MDIDTINNEIFNFTDNLFNDSLDIIEENFAFFEKVQLISPKKNHFFLLHFLNTTINNFSNLDYAFCSKTLKKIHTNINSLNKLYQIHENYSQNIETIFTSKVITKIALFQDMDAEIKELHLNTFLNDSEKEKIAIIKKQHSQMKEIYLETFTEDFTSQNKSILQSLKEILNTKLYYFDKILWIEANNSPVITRLFKNMNLTHAIDSKAYINYRLGLDLPYSEEYKYLLKCLRIYK